MSSQKKEVELRKLALISLVISVALFMLGMAFKIATSTTPESFWSAYLWGSLLCLIAAVALYLLAVYEECSGGNN